MPAPDDPIPGYARPPGVDDATVEAVGTLSEAFEALQDARGHLYAFHRLMGRTDLTLGEAIEQLRTAGHVELAGDLETDLLGRNVLAGRWTFQVVDEFEDGYHAAFAEHERRVREELVGGSRHLHEAEMKAAERTGGHAGHEASPAD